MKKLLLSTVAGLAIAGSSLVANASGNTDTATADALAKVVAPISIDNTADLDFGSFTVGSIGGTVDSATGADGVDVITVPGAATTNNAAFAVAGEDGYLYDVTVPATIDLIGTADVALSVVGGATGRTGGAGAGGGRSVGGGGARPG